MSIRKEQAGFGEGIDVGRERIGVPAETANVVVQVIDDDENDVPLPDC